jgi:serine/threonine-protein kinase HipA
VTYSFNPHGLWTSSHQMSMHGKWDDFVMEDFRLCGKNAWLKRGQAKAIVNEIIEVVKKWPSYTKKVKIHKEW